MVVTRVSRILRRRCGTGIALSAAFVLALPTPGLADADYDHLYGRWRAGQYAEVVSPLLDYRERPYGRCAQVDYLIATSLCRMPGFESDGAAFFSIVLGYNLERSSRQVVEREMGHCNEPTPPSPTDVVAARRGAAGVEFHGKMYPLSHPPPGVPVTAERIQIDRVMSEAELAARRFAPADSDSAEQAVQALAGSAATVRISRSFIIADLARHRPEQLVEIARYLEDVLDRFSAQYGMPRPPCMLTVYLTGDASELRDLANKLHGIRVSSQCIGYSIPEDMSMVAVIPGVTCGTLSHEMFHLLVRSHFGDVPPWMDEGLAALYESPKITDSTIVGTPNWRGDVLRTHHSLLPSIRQLVTMNWDMFDQTDGGSYERQAVNHATARYFMLYVQEEGKLTELYKSFRERDVRKLGHSIADDPVIRVEEVLGVPIASIETSFGSWCEAKITH